MLKEERQADGFTWVLGQLDAGTNHISTTEGKGLY